MVVHKSMGRPAGRPRAQNEQGKKSLWGFIPAQIPVGVGFNSISNLLQKGHCYAKPDYGAGIFLVS